MEQFCMGASILRVAHSIEAMEDYMDEIAG